MTRPTKIRMLKTVRPDFPFLLDEKRRGIILISGQEYPCLCNPLGAVAAVFPDGVLLGVKPDEFEVVESEPLSR